MSGQTALAQLIHPPSVESSTIDTLLVSDDVKRKWYVLHTKSRREKKLTQRCAQLGIRHYLPLRKSITGRRGRRHIADVPLFPGYMFSYLDRMDRYRLLSTGHVANALNVVDQQGLLNDLRNIKDASDRNALLEPTSIVKRGQLVRIMDGPLIGLEGVVRSHKGRYRLILAIDCIQQAVACEIDIRTVAPI